MRVRLGRPRRCAHDDGAEARAQGRDALPPGQPIGRALARCKALTPQPRTRPSPVCTHPRRQSVSLHDNSAIPTHGTPFSSTTHHAARAPGRRGSPGPRLCSSAGGRLFLGRAAGQLAARWKVGLGRGKCCRKRLLEVGVDGGGGKVWGCRVRVGCHAGGGRPGRGGAARRMLSGLGRT